MPPPTIPVSIPVSIPGPEHVEAPTTVVVDRVAPVVRPEPSAFAKVLAGLSGLPPGERSPQSERGVWRADAEADAEDRNSDGDVLESREPWSMARG